MLTQLDTSLDIALNRMDGITDDEYRWLPEPDASTVERDDSGRLRPKPLPDDAPRTRTIILLTGHLGEMALQRADYTTGGHNLGINDVTWPETADAGIEFLRHSWSVWRAALNSLEDRELDVVGRCDFPHGLDPTVPVLDIAWWMNRELIHHTAEIAFVRDLYARRPVG